MLNYILSEVKKYQGFISSKDDGKIYVGSCLPLLAVSFLFSFLTVFSQSGSHSSFTCSTS